MRCALGLAADQSVLGREPHHVEAAVRPELRVQVLHVRAHGVLADIELPGDLADPDVVFLSPTAVGKRVLRLLENIIKLPVEIISPILPKEKEREK